MRLSELIVFKHFEKEDGELLKNMAFLMDHYEDSFYNLEDLKELMYESINRLLEFGAETGLSGNLWHCYLTYLLVNNENSYSKACEIRGESKGSINTAALHDIRIIKELFDFDFKPLISKLSIDGFEIIEDYLASDAEARLYNSRIRNRICDLANRFDKETTPEGMKKALTDFYKEYGVGRFGLHKAFRVTHDENGTHIIPILKIAHVKLDDLVGYESAKKKLVDNTEAFLDGKKANNCLLFGEAGTGKSSSIKAISNEYYERGLRIIEVYKHQFLYLNDIISQIKNRNYKFIIYMDDLSFEEFETEYKYLKAVIEGGLEKKPENVLIYATSNRRHLVRERFSDKEETDDDLHSRDTVEEKLSLSSRFGVNIYFASPDKKEFQNIVKVLAKRNDISMPEDELLLEANKWEIAHGGLSGRTAQQFIDYIVGLK